jgi:hypothetical protein
LNKGLREILPKKVEAEKLQTHFKKPEKALILAFYRLDDVRKYMKKGEAETANKLTGYIKHYVHDALGLLNLTEEQIKAQKPKPYKSRNSIK